MLVSNSSWVPWTWAQPRICNFCAVYYVSQYSVLQAGPMWLQAGAAWDTTWAVPCSSCMNIEQVLVSYFWSLFVIRGSMPEPSNLTHKQHMGWYWVTQVEQSSCSLLVHPSFLFCKQRHNTHSSTVCQCPGPDHTAHCLHFKDLRAINPRWWQLTPHNHQGREYNFFVRNHLCSEQLLSRCQWLSSSFHALRCGFYLLSGRRALPLSDCICHFMPSSSALPAKGLPNQLKIQKWQNMKHNITKYFVTSCLVQSTLPAKLLSNQEFLYCCTAQFSVW